jgi:hypothetical protein
MFVNKHTISDEQDCWEERQVMRRIVTVDGNKEKMKKNVPWTTMTLTLYHVMVLHR